MQGKKLKKLLAASRIRKRLLCGAGDGILKDSKKMIVPMRRDMAKGFEAKESVGLSEHVCKIRCSFHDDYMFVVFIDLSVHDLRMSFVGTHFVLKIDDMTHWTMRLTSFGATLSQHRIIATVGLIEV